MEENNLQMPVHVAIILDGNGRWAKEHHVPRKLGHKAGCENLEQIVKDAAEMGIQYLTVYGFSTENWKRSEEEVGALMSLFRFYIGRLKTLATENNVRVLLIGERSRFAQDLIDAINDAEASTKNNTGMTFLMALNYGSRDEIVRGMRRMAEDVKNGKLAPEEIEESTISSYLDTAGIPDPDLMIRTSGEQRLSNYLLWQLAYAEMYFTPIYWPDFHKKELLEAIEVFNRRNRRFGGR